MRGSASPRVSARRLGSVSRPFRSPPNGLRMYAYRLDRKGGILKGSLYIPSLTQEMNVGTAFSAKVPDAVAVAVRRARFRRRCASPKRVCDNAESAGLVCGLRGHRPSARTFTTQKLRTSKNVIKIYPIKFSSVI